MLRKPLVRQLISPPSVYDFMLIDENADGNMDLKIPKIYYQNQSAFGYYLWFYDKEKNTLNQVEGYDSIIAPRYNKQNNKVYAYLKLGCADADRQFKRYYVKDNKVTLEQKLDILCCLSQGEKCILKNTSYKKDVIIGQKEFKISREKFNLLRSEMLLDSTKYVEIIDSLLKL